MERRNNNRMDSRVALEARAHGRIFSTQLYDISPTGCRFDCSALVFSRGDRIVFKFNGETKVAGKIAWRRGVTAGVQFSSPLPQTIARHLRCESAKPPSEIPSKDWFLR